MTVSGPSTIDPRSDDDGPRPSAPSAVPGEPRLPEPPREGFELGAIDVSAERPSHGLSSDRGTRWLVGGLVGGSLLLAGLITLVRGGDDEPQAQGDRIELQAALGDPVRASVLALESVRLEAITIATARALADGAAEPPKTSARRTERTGSATPAATMPARATREAEAARGSTPPAIDELPPPPPEPEAEAKPDDASATPSSSAEPAAPPPTVDAPEPDEAADAPSGV